MRLVLVPGFTQTVGAWAPVIAALPLRTDVTALDVPVAPTFDATVDELADAGGRGCWAGYSMGGRLALSLALARPDVVERLVLVSAGVGIAGERDRAARRASDDALAEAAERDGAAAFLDRWLAREMFAGLPPEARAARVDDGRVIAHQLRVLGAAEMPPRHDRLAELTMPVLVVTGRDDDAYDAIGGAIARAAPNARHERVDGGHGLLHENPRAVADLIARFL